MKGKAINLAWNLGVRVFRLSRTVGMSTTLEPAFAKLARIVPTSKEDVAATLANGATLWMPPGYRDTRTVVNGLFQSDETRLFKRLTQPGMTFLDIGAYVGYFAVLASEWVGPGGRVYAFEPDDLAFQYLVKNLRVNGCANAIPINKAATDRAATVGLVRDPKGPESFLTDFQTDGGGSISVETTTLDTVLGAANWPRVDLMKMNIEGSELFALRGMKEISLRNPRLQLVMEFNPTAMERLGISRQDLALELAELGFKRGRIVERDLAPVPSGELLPRGSVVYNVLLTK